MYRYKLAHQTELSNTELPRAHLPKVLTFVEKESPREIGCLVTQAVAKTLLELGSGPGRDGAFFRDHGLHVTCTDLSPAMVARCRAKGLEALTVDFMSLDFASRTFDAVYALNSLLHVPKTDLPAVLERVRAQLVPGGLFYLGIYGGRDFEGVRPDDRHEPKRFFAFYKDRDLLTRLLEYFELVYFRQVALSTARGADFHFQSFVLQRGKE